MDSRHLVEPERAAGKVLSVDAPAVVVMRWLPKTVPSPMPTAAMLP